MGWNDAPDYTPPDPPAWFWWIAGGVVLAIMAGCAWAFG